jgi:polyisoprenoid-binding protein YceI
MVLKTGTYHLTANSGKLYVYTYKEGFLSAVAHDLLIEVTNFTVNINILDANTVNGEAEIQANSLKVICAMKDGQYQYDTLKEKDKADIEEATFKDVLHVSKYPSITFCFQSITQRDEGVCHIKGELTLHGVTRPVEFDAKTTMGKDLKGRITLTQKDFGIKPYKALLGTLKVKNEVDVAFDLTLS